MPGPGLVLYSQEAAIREMEDAPEWDEEPVGPDSGSDSDESEPERFVDGEELDELGVPVAVEIDVAEEISDKVRLATERI